jgi:hypothetical protein
MGSTIRISRSQSSKFRPKLEDTTTRNSWIQRFAAQITVLKIDYRLTESEGLAAFTALQRQGYIPLKCI